MLSCGPGLHFKRVVVGGILKQIFERTDRFSSDSCFKPLLQFFVRKNDPDPTALRMTGSQYSGYAAIVGGVVSPA